MKFSQVIAMAAATHLASAHTTVWSISVNGKDAGTGNSAGGYIDSPPNNNPVTDVTSAAMECNVAGVKASKSITVKGGDKIAFQWGHNAAGDDIIADSHKGPINVYASKAGSKYSWTKIWSDGLTDGKWAVDKLLAGSYNGKKGQHDLTLPMLAPGDYVLRPEINALHEGNREGGAQFYMECVHIKVEGSGTKVLPAGVSFPGAYKATDPGVLFDIYAGKTTYPGVGPAVWDGASSAGSGSAPAPAETTAAAAPTAAAPTTMATSAKPAPTKEAETGAGAGAAVAKYAQCGGKGYSGATACSAGTCTKQNDYYSQCI